MSLEQAIQNLADAINNHAEAIRGSTHAAHIPAAPATPDTPKKDAAKPAAKQDPVGAQTTPASVEAPAEKPLDYETDIKPRFLKLVEVCGRDAGRKLIDEYKTGATRLVEAITPAQYPEVLAKINAELGAKS